MTLREYEVVVWWLDTSLLSIAGVTFLLAAGNAAFLLRLASRSRLRAFRVAALSLALLCGAMAMESLLFLALAKPSALRPVGLLALLVVRMALLLATGLLSLLMLRGRALRRGGRGDRAGAGD